MTVRYDVYGFETLDIEAAKELVEHALSLQLEQRDSSYWGVYYCCQMGTSTARNFMLYQNEQGEWHTPEHQAYKVILLVNELDNMDEIQHQLISERTEPILLRSRILPDEAPDDDEED